MNRHVKIPVNPDGGVAMDEARSGMKTPTAELNSDGNAAADQARMRVAPITRQSDRTISVSRKGSEQANSDKVPKGASLARKSSRAKRKPSAETDPAIVGAQTIQALPDRTHSIPGDGDGEKTNQRQSPIRPVSSRPNTRGKRKRAVEADPASRAASSTPLSRDRQPFGSDADDRRAIWRAGTKSTLPDDPLSNAGISRRRSGRISDETHHHRAGPATLSTEISEITQLWRMRQRWHRAEKSLTLQGKAICRSYLATDDLHSEDEKKRTKAQNAVKTAAGKLFDQVAAGGEADPHVVMALEPYLTSIRNFEPMRATIEKRLRKLARSLPIWPWVADIKGFGDLNLAALVGEAGDVGSYRNPSCLWKRMGLAVISGERQRKKSDVEAALAHGYSPPRRAVAYLLGDTLSKQQLRAVKDNDGERTGESIAQGRYGEIYLRRKAYEAARTDDGKPASKAHAHNRSARYMVKRVLRDLWAVWRAAGHRSAETPCSGAGGPSSMPSDCSSQASILEPTA